MAYLVPNDNYGAKEYYNKEKINAEKDLKEILNTKM